MKDDTIIAQLYAFKNDSNSDWYVQLSNAQKKQIQKGLDDIDNGRTITHEEIMQAARQKIEQLKK